MEKTRTTERESIETANEHFGEYQLCQATQVQDLF